MNITTEKINNFFKDFKKSGYSTAKNDLQFKIEEDMLYTNYKECKFLNNKIIENLPNIDFETFKLNIGNNFYNEKIIDLLKCFVNSIIFESDNVKNNSIIKKYFTNLNQIGDESANGIALSSGFNNISDFFVIKAPQNPNNSYELIHECFVAFHGTNKLRALIPNFSYIYGLKNCSLPFLDNKEVISWCENKKIAVNYIIYEKINNSISLSKYIETCTSDQFIEIFLQILFSLKIAAREIGFTHYDLHTENILLRKIDTPSFIKYDDIFLKTENYVATIIDYGMSNIMVDSINYGSYDTSLENIGVTNICKIGYDCYKLICFSIGLFYNKNKSFYNNLIPLFKYFNKTEDFVSVITNQFPSRYSFPFTDETSGFNIDEFIEYTKTLSTKFIIKTELLTTDNLLNCSNGLCKTEESFIKEINFNTNEVIATSYETFVYQLENGNQEKIILNDFDFLKAFRLEKDSIVEKINKLTNYNIIFVSLPLADLDEIFGNIELILDNFYKSVKFINLFFDLKNIYKNGYKVINYFNIDSKNDISVFYEELWLLLNGCERTDYKMIHNLYVENYEILKSYPNMLLNTINTNFNYDELIKLNKQLSKFSTFTDFEEYFINIKDKFEKVSNFELVAECRKFIELIKYLMILEKGYLDAFDVFY